MHGKLQLIKNLIKNERNQLSSGTQKTILDLVIYSRSIFEISSFICMLDQQQISREDNQEIWDAIFEKVQKEKSEDTDPLTFSRVVEAISNQGKDDPKSLQQVSELLKEMPENCLSVATVL